MSAPQVLPAEAAEALPPSSIPVWLSFVALAMGGFGIGTGEFVIMGLLPDVARDLHITIPQAGHAISTYALGVVIGAPLLAVLGVRLPRRAFLIALMAMFSIGNIASALAPNYLTLIGLRFLSGLPHGTYFGVASLVAASLVPSHRRVHAVGQVMLGLTLATLFGVPLAAGLGQWLGWRAAFVLVGAIGALTAFMVWRWVPNVPAPHGASPLRELSALRSSQVWLTLGIGAIGFGGMFAVFSYIKPTLMQVAGVPEAWVPFYLALFGVGMVAGTIVGPRLVAAASLMRAIGGTLIWSALLLGAFTFTSSSPWLAGINVLAIGTIIIIGPALQIRLMDVAGEAQTLAAALNHSAFNMANAAGAWLGGVAITAGYGWTSTGWVGALLSCAGMLMFVWARYDARRKAR
ncbi:MFS transporter [Pandoraea pulmonicola]|uniref:Inner membrane transport protein ydhP n=1 Tax=Pandoraea pulmonicola TaxID=93221 RepID=A0AAJ5CYK7_PANPU|nr:MFS transporter [Pandoraea pulmonicola]SUA88642.1 Inner membrane transport protein ydhP [Pandoraea pulmonicola]